jgi:tRNA (guanine-N7-)-methyltransferase
MPPLAQNGPQAPERPAPLPPQAVLLPESFADEPGQIDFAALFGNRGPVEIEIGSGKGTFLVHRAAARPEVNFLGIEWARAYCIYAADRMCRRGLSNVRMLRADAQALFAQRVPDNSLMRVHIYFPDPWPRSRHQKRRLIKPSFVRILHAKLRIGGELVAITDHQNYARQIEWSILGQRGFAIVGLPRTHGAQEDELVGTNFERKYILQGRRFYDLAVMKWR